MKLLYSTLCLIFTLLALSTFAVAQTHEMQLCDRSIETVSKSTFVPHSVLIKIARLESGRSIQNQTVSWPWTLNNAGKGYYFGSKSATLEKLRKLMAAGKKNIDVGCMQLNIRWHSRYFADMSAMLSPFENVSYAAKYLEQLYNETGSWEKAIKYYHSRNPKFNSVYYAKFSSMAEPDLGELSKPLLASAALNTRPLAMVQPSSSLKGSLIWVEPQGSLLFAGAALSKPAFADIREFRVAPLVPSLQ